MNLSFAGVGSRGEDVGEKQKQVIYHADAVTVQEREGEVFRLIIDGSGRKANRFFIRRATKENR